MLHNEFLLHYVWKYRLLDHSNLETTDGKKIEIIDPGIHNSDSGPDFFNSKIKIDDKVWAGNVEIHLSSDDWYKHKHHQDRSYNSTILHVVQSVDGDVINEQQQIVPQMKITIPSNVKYNAELLLKSKYSIPCKTELSKVKRHVIRPWLSVLAIERLERKTSDIELHLKRFNNSWDDVFFVILARNYGFGLNSDEFERLAMSIGFKIIRRHSDSLFQIESLLYGQAGMLGDDKITDDYYLRLKEEYAFLAHKYQLKPLESFVFKRLRVRPTSFPQIRIAQFASLLVQSQRLFSTVLEIEDYRKMRLHFQSEVSSYWKNHYSFGKETKESKTTNSRIGDSSLDVILINSVVPVLFSYGKKTDQEKYCDKALEILESIKPEQNSLVREFVSSGIRVENAFDTQALIQLRKEYCDKRKCLYCKIGYGIMTAK